MKTPVLLKTILDICFILLIISYGSLIFTYVGMLFFDFQFPIEINNNITTEFTWKTTMIVLANVIVSGISIYIIYLLRKLIRSFFKEEIFSRLQISLFNLIGQLIVLCTIAQFFIDSFANLILENRAKLRFTIDSAFDSSLFILALGLFFIYLGKLFRNRENLNKKTNSPFSYAN
ncbi:DUF2975 domain-containing protein [Salegentibacter mishustinae]|uniref:DUF2975 domain-containing protein n=1 Tax=Salegentibacter mishustinae TaxID=270918 RepID=UPI003CD0DCB4